MQLQIDKVETVTDGETENSSTANCALYGEMLSLKAFLSVLFFVIFAVFPRSAKTSSCKINIPRKSDLAKLYSTGEVIHTDITRRILLLQFISFFRSETK